jgi:lysophospholipase L1-like esterase
MFNLVKSTLYTALTVCLFSCSTSAQEQQAPFYNDVQTIKAYDKIYAPPQNPILFIGSSSIRLWVDFSRSFKDYTVLNRGIGGAVTADIDRYLEDIAFPYQPKQVVLYVGENDLVKAPDAETVFASFKKLYAHLRTKLPETPLLYLAIKGSPSRIQLQDKAIKANQLISSFLKGEKNTVFIDVYKPMLDKAGKMQPSLFKSDMLHMNGTGYAIWNKLLIPKLIKN